METVIALAIMVVSLAAILAVESSSIQASNRAKQMSVVAMLAKNLMIDVEYQLEGKSFTEIKPEESGSFDPPFQDYRWTWKIKEIQLPELSVASGGGESASSGGSPSSQNDSIGLLTKLLTKFLSQSIREVKVSVLWKKGSLNQDFSVTTYWVDLNHEFSTAP